MCLHVSVCVCMYVFTCVCVAPQGEDGEGDRGEPAPVTTQPSTAAAAAPSTGDPEKDKKIRNIKKVAVYVSFCFLSIHTHCVSVCVYIGGEGGCFMMNLCMLILCILMSVVSNLGMKCTCLWLI